jgi:dTDP-D-glucose 4,6-dehydratase
VLGWKPTTSLRDGLKATIAWFERQQQPRAATAAVGAPALSA